MIRRYYYRTALKILYVVNTVQHYYVIDVIILQKILKVPLLKVK